MRQKRDRRSSKISNPLKQIASAAGIDISAIELSYSPQLRVYGAHAWGSSSAELTVIRALKDAAVAEGYVIWSQTSLGFSVARPTAVPAIRERAYVAQAPRWKG